MVECGLMKLLKISTKTRIANWPMLESTVAFFWTILEATCKMSQGKCVEVASINELPSHCASKKD